MARIYSFKAGSKIPDEIVGLASREKVKAALLTGIGGVSEARIAYFNQETKQYENHDYREELEVTSLIGNVTIKEGKPFVHVHGTFSRRDMTVIGGHVMTATVSPLLELVVTPTSNSAVRKLDEGLGLWVIRR